METGVEFSSDDWDDVSNTSTIHLAYFIQNLLPVRLVGWKAVRRHYDSVMACIPQNDATSSPSISYVVTGSTAEGFGIPNCMTRTNPPIMERFSDVDTLMVCNDILISTNELPIPNNTEFKGYFDSEGLHPGYTRICLPSIKALDDTFIFDTEREKYYFSATQYIEKLSSKDFELDAFESWFIQGPAITVENSLVLSLENLKKPNAGGSFDMVTTLKCTPWPKEASDWKERAMKSNWLSEDIIQSIIDDGCHVVAVPSKKSLKPDLEWRMSFSASEGKLARDAVTDQQRQCYIYLKILRYQVMKPVSVLSSYVFKSVFLYCCEKLPVDYWAKYPGKCILYMLDVILDCLRKKFVPTYFLPENNLVDHLTGEELNAAILAVEALRADPITPVLDFTDDRVVGYQCLLMNYRELTKPLLDDMKLFEVHRNKEMSVMCGIMHTGIFMCQFLLHEQSSDREAELVKHQEAVRIMIDIYTLWLFPMGLNASLIQFMNSAGLTIKNVKLCVRFFQALLSLSSEYPEFSVVRGNLACMYHGYAYTDKEQSTIPNDEYMKKAGELFEQVYSENKRSAIDYVTYLVKLKKFAKAEEILEDFLQIKGDEMTSSFIYNESEMNTLENPLRQHVADCGSISGDGVSFAYFYLIKCLVETDQEVTTQRIVDTLERFEKHCKEKNDNNASLLLEYARSIARGKIEH